MKCALNCTHSGNLHYKTFIGFQPRKGEPGMLYSGKRWILASKTHDLKVQPFILIDMGDKETKKAARIPIPYF